MNRRDLLKLFGAGAVIAPAAGATPLARLMEPAKVELIKPEPRIVRPIDTANVLCFDVTLHLRDGSSETMYAQTLDWRGTASTGDDLRLLFVRENLHSPSSQFQVAELSGRTRQ